eukprot:TRINITY_DN9306_c0_g1_i1.p1 TRINITY_DN9306_c0_g1~~TRINITY_DN9306_c0_g1_i1.p1  ORF type:complete len:488 (-),score=60.32 TRINITY_DN9306_c0_g1_i1:209-1672(-)
MMAPAAARTIEGCEVADGQAAETSGPKTVADVFKLRNVMFILLAQCLNMVFAQSALGPIFDGWLLVMAKRSGRSDPNFIVGTVETVRGVTMLIVAIPLGIITDKCSTRANLLRWNVVPMVVSSVLLLVAILSDCLWLLYVGLCLYGVWNQMLISTADVLLADSVPRQFLTDVMAAKGTISLIGTSTGPALQCILILIFGNSWNANDLHAALGLSFLTIIPVIMTLCFLEEPQLQATVDGSQASSSPARTIKSWAEGSCLGLPIKWFIPILFQIAGLISGVGSGMTVRFFPLFFQTDYAFKPFWINLLMGFYTLCIACMVQVAKSLSKRIGRMQVWAVFMPTGIVCLVIFVSLRNLWFVIPVFLLRGALMNSTAPLMQAVLFDCVDSKYRGRLNALSSLFRFTWCGSAAMGGWLADRQDYRASFLWTAGIQAVAGLFRLPALFVVPRFEVNDVPALSEPLHDVRESASSPPQIQSGAAELSPKPVIPK